jgi:hypothetical protein
MSEANLSSPSPLTGGEAETGKGPADLFPAERVRECSAHPGQEHWDGGDLNMATNSNSAHTPTLTLPRKGGGDGRGLNLICLLSLSAVS